MSYITVRLWPATLHCLLLSKGQATAAIPLRLTPTQASLIRRGVDFLATNYAARRDKKFSQFCYPFSVYPPPHGFDRGTFNKDMMARTLSLRTTLAGKRRGGRVHLDAIQIRVAIAAVRITYRLSHLGAQRATKNHWNADTQRRWEFDPESIKALRRRCTRTISSLERHLKRANHLLRVNVSAEEYLAISQAWRSHLRWMRLHLACFKPLPPVIKNRKAQQQRNLDVLVDIATCGIRSNGQQPPDAQQLRKLMRLYVRYCRRGRIGWQFSYREILGHPVRAADQWYLARFVSQRLKLERQT